jgi:phage repressor protein C with HTH and peptisase S24 domain
MSKSQELRAAIMAFMRDRDLNVHQWAQRAKIPESTLRSFTNGTAQAPRYDTLLALAQDQGVSVSEMMGEPTAAQRLARDVVPIRALAVKPASKGGGFEIDDHADSRAFYFRKERLDSMAIKSPARCRIYWFEGRDMEPTINDGDAGLVFLDYGTVKPGAYALWDGQGVICRRLEMLPGSPPRLRVSADNRQLIPYELPIKDAYIIGRVIWRGGAV